MSNPRKRPAPRAGRQSAPARARRRRGTTLEAAILDAAWAELGSVGYANLTMDAVATRAATSKPVLYRRWPNRAQLVLATLRRRFGSISQEVPDTGTLRGDVLALLRRVSQRYVQFSDVIEDLMSDLPDVQEQSFHVLPEVMLAILNRAAERGEIGPLELTPRIAALPLDLVRHEMFVTRAPVPEQVLTEIVDDIFLPLVAAGSKSH